MTDEADWLTQLPWHDVTAVGIRTTADGPFAEDLFWQLVIGDRVLELPGSLVGGDALAALGARLPGFDYARVIAATGSTEERWFSVWDREVPPAPADDALVPRFAALVAALHGETAAARDVAVSLVARWREPARHYHNTAHLAACLHELDAAGGDPRIELALWYHDAIYQPGTTDCEARSAELLLADAAALAIDPALARSAAALVRATAHASDTASGDPVIDLIVDIDLAILGARPLRFMDYEHSIEDEYAAIPTCAFRVARGRFLAGLLARPRLFRTPAFHARYEARARAQITGLLAGPRYRAYRWLRGLPA